MKRPSFSDLLRFRREWKELHQAQDREKADRLFEELGLGSPSDGDLAFLSTEFREKAAAFGREWERALIVAAHREGYALLRADLMLDAAAIQAFYAWIEACLGEIRDGKPLGASLFFESRGPDALQGGSWSTFFYFNLQAGAEPGLLGIDSAPGVQGNLAFERVAA